MTKEEAIRRIRDHLADPQPTDHVQMLMRNDAIIQCVRQIGCDMRDVQNVLTKEPA